MNNKKQLVLGIIIGFMGPIIFLFLGYYMNNIQISFYLYFKELLTLGMAVPTLSLCTLFNLGTFFMFIRFEKDQISKGILLMTIIWGIVLFSIKFL